MMGMFIVHPKDPDEEKVDRDFVWMPHAWKIDPGTSRPNPAEMTDFNIWSLNGRIFPATLPMVVATGQRVRIRVGNLSMMEHPMHLHGHHFEVSGTDAGPIPPERRWREATVQVPVGTTRDIVFVADNPGDWAYHCHKSHHTMNAMSHSFPNMVGVDQGAAAAEISRLVPGYMPMGKSGMAEMQGMSGMMPGPRNTAPMMAGRGPYGSLGMGGMFTTLKVRDALTSYEDPGWYKAPAGTIAWRVA
jgi:FtsP/CotA-like multicopper oxidase with cupredoxin domain